MRLLLLLLCMSFVACNGDLGSSTNTNTSESTFNPQTLECNYSCSFNEEDGTITAIRSCSGQADGVVILFSDELCNSFVDRLPISDSEETLE